MSDKMREVPPITDETYKALMVALGMPNNRSLLSALQQIANHATQRAAWQAEQSVPVVREPMADAAKSIASMIVEWVQIGIKNGGTWQEGLPSLIERRLQRCWPTNSIPATELERLRKDAERYRWLRDGNDNKKSAACHIAVNCYGLEWDDAIDAAIAQEPRHD